MSLREISMFSHFQEEAIFKLFKYANLYQMRQGVYALLLNKVEKRNALDSEMVSELIQGLLILKKRKDLKVLLISGNGPHFSAGADIDHMKKQGKSTKAKSLQDANKLSTLFYSLASFPAPVVTLVRGAVVGGAVGLVACSDYVFADKSAFFCTSEVKLGIIPAVISPYIMRKIGVSKASRMMIFAEKMSAEEGKELGLVHVTLSFEEEKIKLTEFLEHLTILAPGALRKTKALILKECPLPSVGIRKMTMKALVEARSSQEGQEGLDAFLNKKLPPWHK